MVKEKRHEDDSAALSSDVKPSASSDVFQKWIAR
jgi:hypothetical protein